MTPVGGARGARVALAVHPTDPEPDLREVEVPALRVARLGRVVGEERMAALYSTAATTRAVLGDVAVWNVSSTAHGGGVAEMLQLLVGYVKDLGVDVHWAVIGGDPAFFALTKRIHNRIHGASDDGHLGRRDDALYRAVLEPSAVAMGRRLRPGDVVLLHDPQTVGMAPMLAGRGIRIVWRCHIGADQSNRYTEDAWAFLQPYLAACDAFVFSHPAFVPPQLAGREVVIIEPSIDPLSPKNRPLSRSRVVSLLTGIGLLCGERADDGQAIVGDAPPFRDDDRLVVQVSRWDHLKDMAGVMEGFAEHLVRRSDARLALIGPAVTGIADDPEGAQVLAECADAWMSLPARARNRIRLVTLPLDDIARNALTVNAAQRHATVVVQKSLQEGFGLTVTEAMWKARPVLASAVGGIVGQVPPGTGVLLHDPTDLDAFGTALTDLLARPDDMKRLGRRARRHVRARYLSDRQLVDHAHLLQRLASA